MLFLQLSRLLFKNKFSKTTLSLCEREWCRCVHASTRVDACMPQCMCGDTGWLARVGFLAMVGSDLKHQAFGQMIIPGHQHQVTLLVFMFLEQWL